MAAATSADRGQRRIGVEIELVCPVGRSRHTLADEIAALAAPAARGDSWHFDTEPSAHDEIDVFHNLTPAIDVRRDDGMLLATVRDDSSIVADLMAERRMAPISGPPIPRIVSDDRRLLRLLASQIDPCDPLGPSLLAACAALHLDVQQVDGGRLRVVDDDGETVAVTGALPPDRLRVAEVVSPPLTSAELRPWLDMTCAAARSTGATAPVEGAVHLHFDAAPFEAPDRCRRLVQWFARHHDTLRRHVGTNRRCRTLGRFEPGLLTAASAPAPGDWPEYRASLYRQHRTRRGDVNLRGLLRESPAQPTIELRFLPVSLDPERIVEWAFSFGGVLDGLASGVLDATSPLTDEQLAGLLADSARHRRLGPTRSAEDQLYVALP